jgi:hypothetical protein
VLLQMKQEVDTELTDINVPELRNMFQTLPNEVIKRSSLTPNSTKITTNIAILFSSFLKNTKI